MTRQLNLLIIGVVLAATAASLLSGALVVYGDLPSHPTRTILAFGVLASGVLVLAVWSRIEWAIVAMVFFLPFPQNQPTLKVVYVGFIIGCVILLALTSKLKLRLHRGYYLVFGFLGYLAVVGVAMPVLPVPFDSGSRLEEFVRHTSNLSLFLAVASVAGRKEWLERIILAVFFSAVAVSLVGVLGIGESEILSRARETGLVGDALQHGRAFSLLGHPNLNGQFTSLSLLVLIGCWTQMQLGRRRIWFGAGLFLMFANLILTGSRGAILGFGFGLLVLLLLISGRGIRKVLARASVGLAVMGIPFAAVALREERWLGLVRRIIVPLDPSLLFDELSVRPALWQASWDAFSQSPLWGVGPRNLGYYFVNSPLPALARLDTSYIQFLQAHNIYLQFLATTGILGLSGLLLVVAVYLCKGYIASRTLGPGLVRGVVAGSSAAITNMLITGLVQTTLGEAWSTWQVFAILLGLLASCNTTNCDADNDQS